MVTDVSIEKLLEDYNPTYRDSYNLSILGKYPSTCLHYWRDTCEDVKEYFGDGSVDIWKDGHCAKCPNRRDMAFSTFYKYNRE